MGRRMKHTDIGDIPADWKLQTFEETFRVLSNNTLSRENLNNKGGAVRNIHYGDILTKFPEVLNCNEEDIPYLNDLSLITANTQLLQDGDVVIADTAEDDTVGKTIEVQNLGNGKLVAGLHTIPCRVKKGDFAPGWLGYYMNSYIYHDQIIPFITGIKVSSISKTAIAETIILVPPVEEQERIVETLSQLDSLIKQETSVSEKLNNVKSSCLSKIFPKDDEKKPEMRFPEFTDAWEQRELSDEFERFIVPMRDKPKQFGGNLPWTRIEDIEGKYLNDSLSGQYVTDETVKQMNLKIIPKDSLIVSSSATFGVVAVVTQDLITNQTFIGLVPNDNETLDYWYAFFYSNGARRYMKSESAGSTIFYIARESFEKMPIKIPLKSEMLKIGAYFDTIDHLITLHQRKCDKYKSIKAGLIRKLFP